MPNGGYICHLCVVRGCKRLSVNREVFSVCECVCVFLRWLRVLVKFKGKDCLFEALSQYKCACSTAGNYHRLPSNELVLKCSAPVVLTVKTCLYYALNCVVYLLLRMELNNCHVSTSQEIRADLLRGASPSLYLLDPRLCVLIVCFVCFLPSLGIKSLQIGSWLAVGYTGFWTLASQEKK